jgi:two-component system cell cycle sensor histidine kinase/response regulator CckA
VKKKRPARRTVSSRDRVPAASTLLLAAALRAQNDGVFIAGSQLGPRGLKILFVNTSFCAMTGYTASRLIGRAHGILHVEKSDLDRLRRWLPAARPGQSLGGEGYVVRPDRSILYAAWNFDPVCDARGRVKHVVATYRDTTEKRRLQEALVHSQRLDAVGRLAGGVAHDFNNLISVINGYCQILAGQIADNPQALREVEEIHKAGQKAATLTRQLLAFGRRQPMNSRVINLNHVVRDNHEILQRLLGTAGRLAPQLDPELGNIRADPAQIQQVLLNLVINARDALRDNGCVTISTANREIPPGLNRRLSDTPPGRYVLLSVGDNGTGMDADTQAHLFEPFFTTKDEGKGTGLGLALVYGVVQQSGGFITVRSTLLVGSTFEILLPLVQEPAERASTPSLPSLPATRGHETVLLVEEDAVVSKMVAGILTADGYRVLTARHPGQALREAQREGQPVQLLIAPFNILGSESEKLARAMHVARPGLRVLNTGTVESPPLVWLAPQHQTSLPKPFALSELLKAARKLLDA